MRTIEEILAFIPAEDSIAATILLDAQAALRQLTQIGACSPRESIKQELDEPWVSLMIAAKVEASIEDIMGRVTFEIARES